ncbi:hypothetical protein OAK91_04480 [Planctomycetaceae bacterium]|nr:hypothetical protein [Planctomycetaceae bacterium]
MVGGIGYERGGVMKFRRFNDQGVKEFADYLVTLRANPVSEVPTNLLTNPRLTEPLSVSIDAEPPASFASRMEFAQWLHAAATANDVDIPRNDAGFWAWLSLALFDHVCPENKQGRRKPGADARHLLDTKNWRRRYRHLLQNAYEIFYLHRDDPTRAMVALVNPLHQPGELTEHINGRQEIVTCPGCMSLATFLCIDSEGKRRKGASGEFANIFGKAVNRISRTFDLPLMLPTQSAILLHQKKLRKFVDAALEASTDT